MGKLSKKLIVYLDQNFLSEIAKVEINAKVKPEFRTLYEILHQGVIDEKLVVPASLFHDIETSLTPSLQKRIRSYQGYLGQVDLKSPDHIQMRQISIAIKRFLGMDSIELSTKDIFEENPDQRVAKYKIRVDLTDREFVSTLQRAQSASELSTVKEEIKRNRISYERQKESEIEAHRAIFLTEKIRYVKLFPNNDYQKLMQFASSSFFSKVPSIEISSRLWARILRDFSRVTQPGDAPDVAIISTYFPYADVFATDHYMSGVLERGGFSTKYKTQIFDATTTSLQTFETFIDKHLSVTAPVNTPICALVVYPSNDIKADSWEVYRKLGTQIRAAENRGFWIELIGLDDGAMPSYPDLNKQITFPFYGIQEVSLVKTQPGDSSEKVFAAVRPFTRAKSIKIINSASEVTDNLIESLLEASKETD